MDVRLTLMRLTLLQEAMLPDLIKQAAKDASAWSTKAGLRLKERAEDRRAQRTAAVAKPTTPTSGNT